MATEGLPESLEEKLGDLNLEGAHHPEEPEAEKFEDSKDTPVEETPEEAHASIVDEIKEGVPHLHHVETHDTTDPVPGDSVEGDVVKAEVPEAFQEELKGDHDIVPPGHEETVSVESVKKEVGADDGETTPPTTETPVVITHEPVDTKAPSKGSSIGEKITQTFHKIVGKEAPPAEEST